MYLWGASPSKQESWDMGVGVKSGFEITLRRAALNG